MRLFSQASRVSLLIAETSAVAPAETERFSGYSHPKTKSWQSLRSDWGHDESGFEKEIETPFARVPSDLPAPSGRCGLPP